MTFLFGECSNVKYPTRFHLERQKKSSRKLKEIQNRTYQLNTRERAARPQSMCGCTRNFIVNCLYARPSVALIIYKQRLHVSKHGFICHRPLDRDAIGPKAKAIPYVGSEIQRQTMSMIYLGIPEENVLQKHTEGIERYCFSNVKGAKLASQYVRKLEVVIRRSIHELDLDDESSIHILLAVDSTFGVSKLKYPLYSLLVFDARQHALPVAWVITRNFAKHEFNAGSPTLACGKLQYLSLRQTPVTGIILSRYHNELEKSDDKNCKPSLEY
ncbi:hypothetical protein EJ110_NYTH25762 [Nymphaea thermarum]|nr:hypothetical protein EJ110_NYTH25762 [Nymphaea thermarum]